MRAWDGSLFEVDWAFVTDDNATTLPFVHPFVSGRDEPLGHFDLGYVGEIPVTYAPASNAVVPSRVCGNCYIGDPVWWESGWPSGTPPVVIEPDGFAVGCDKFPMPVQSVGLSAPIEFVVSGSPVTSTGVLTFRWVSEPANTVLAAPDGTAGFPSFRRLTAGDISGAFGMINSVAWMVDATGGTHGLPTIGSYTLQDGESVFNVDTLTPTAIGPWIVHPGPWTRPSWYPSGQTITGYFLVNVINGQINVHGDARACLFQISPYAIGDVFTPWVVDTTPVMFEEMGTGGFLVAGGPGITCTPNVAQPTRIPGTIVVQLADTISPQIISFGIPSTAPSTNNTIFVDPITFKLTFIDNGGIVQNFVFQGSGVVTFRVDIDFTQFNTLPGSTAVVKMGSLPANAIVLNAYSTCDSAWSALAGITSLSWIFTSNTTPPVGGGAPLSLTPNPSGWDNSQGPGSYFSQPVFGTDQMTFWARLDVPTALTDVVSGHSHMFGYFFQRP